MKYEALRLAPPECVWLVIGSVSRREDAKRRVKKDSIFDEESIS